MAQIDISSKLGLEKSTIKLGDGKIYEVDTSADNYLLVQEKIKNQVKKILEKDELEQQKENNNQVKARPKYTKVHRPEPIDYEYEYDESEESEDK